MSYLRLVRVIVACDHNDRIYKVKEETKFSIQVLKYGNLMENVTINYEARPVMLPDKKQEGGITEIINWQTGNLFL
jgi:hypothetical protein